MNFVMFWTQSIIICRHICKTLNLENVKSRDNKLTSAGE